MSAPRYSIVIPTRNRAHLLEYSLRSAMAQRFDDFEIVVSDNHSSDGTASAAAKLADARVRYVRTPRDMNMIDSWEFALQQARGEYITFLCDDDAVQPRLLSTIDAALPKSGAQIAAWSFHGTYHHETSEQVGLRNTLIAVPVRRGTRILSAAALKEDARRCVFPGELPRVLNSCTHRSVFDDVRAKFGRVFFPNSPDYAAAFGQLEVRSEVLVIDDHLVLWGIGNESVGASARTRGAAAQAFNEDLKKIGMDQLLFVPLSMRSMVNCILDTILIVWDRAGDKRGFSQVSLAAYLDAVARDVVHVERAGADLASDFAELAALAQRLPLRERLVFLARFGLHPGGPQLRRARARIRRQIANSWLLSTFEHKTRYGHDPTRVFKGTEHGFTNIFECVSRIESFQLGA
jgi:glycosyltransferase involved in cell wall biosynthesis